MISQVEQQQRGRPTGTHALRLPVGGGSRDDGGADALCVSLPSFLSLFVASSSLLPSSLSPSPSLCNPSPHLPRELEPSDRTVKEGEISRQAA